MELHNIMKETRDKALFTEDLDNNPKEKISIRERVSCCCLGVLLYFMDALTIGRIGLGDVKGMGLPKYSSFLFLLSSVSSQAVFYLFSSFSLGSITTPISENFITFKNLASSLATEDALAEDVLFPTLITFISISTLITGVSFLVLYFLGFHRSLEKIPKEIGMALFFAIGGFCCMFGNASILKMFPYQESSGYNWYFIIGIYNVCGFILWRITQSVGKAYPKFAPFSYFVCFLCTVAFSYVPIFAIFGGIEKARAAEFLPNQANSMTSLSDLPLVANFSFSKISWKILLRKDILMKISGVVLINLMQFPINVPSLSKGCDAKASASKELMANGIANLFGCIFGIFSPYIVVSSTIAFNRNKISTKKIDGVFLISCFAVLYLIGQSLFSYVPPMCLDMLLLFIGFDILLDSIISIWDSGMYYILFTLLVAIPTFKTESLFVGMGIGVAFSLMYYLYTCIQNRRSRHFAYNLPNLTNTVQNS